MSAEHNHANAYICSCGYGLGEYEGSADRRYLELVAAIKATR